MAFVCEYEGCGKQSKSASGLRDHKRKYNHLDLAPDTMLFACSEPSCVHKFETKYARTSHEKQANHHNKVKEFVCEYPECTKAFSSSIALQFHQRTNNHFFFAPGTVLFSCSEPSCTRKFKTKRACSSHEREANHQNKVKSFVCEYPECTKAFLTFSGLKVHRYKANHFTFTPNANLLPCPDPSCSRKFDSRRKLSNHQTSSGHKNITAEIENPEPLLHNKTMQQKIKTMDNITVVKEEQAVATGNFVKLPSHCKWQDGVTWQQCHSCLRWLRRTFGCFELLNGVKLIDSELSMNTYSKLCRECRAHRNGKGSIFLNIITWQYPALTKEWVQKQLQKQDGRGLITNFRMVLENKCDNGLSVHRIDNKLPHVPSNCFFDCLELNVPQHKAIPDLADAWRSIFLHLNSYLQNPTHGSDDCAKFEIGMYETPQTSRITTGKRRLTELDTGCFNTLLNRKIKTHVEMDITRGRLDLSKMIRKKFEQNAHKQCKLLLERQNFRCYYSGIPLTISNTFARFSLERLNNKLPHFSGDGSGLENVVFICRIFNTARQMSRKKLLIYYLHQNLVLRDIESHKKAEELLLQEEDISLAPMSSDQ